MAEKKAETKAKIVLEREYNVPLRKGTQRTPKYKRAKKAITVLREFLQKHMKSENVKIGRFLNDEMWKRGIKNPPHHVKILAKKDDQGVVTAELVGAAEKEKKEETKKSDKKGIKKEVKKGEDQIKEKIEELKEETKEIVEGKSEKEIEQKPVKEKDLPVEKPASSKS